MGAAAIPLILTAVSTAVSVVGSQQQAKTQQGVNNYNAAIARNNAVIANRAAADAIEKGKIAEHAERVKTRQMAGKARANAAARGVQVDTGSAALIVEDTVEIGELDALTIRSNAEREALGFQVQAQGFESQAGFETAAGKNAKKAGRVEAFSTLLGGASKVSSQWSTAYGS